MLSALLTAQKDAVAGQRRSELVMAGETVLAYQTRLVRALGCERVICICDRATPAILAMQREVEASGGQFHVIKNSLQLLALLRSDDRLIVMQDGLICDRANCKELLAVDSTLKPVIYTLDAKSQRAQQHPEDFERIDANRHWAGVAVLKATVVQKLAEMPEDGDILSMLLRLGLQERTETAQIVSSSQHWFLAVGADQLRARDAAVIARALDEAKPETIGEKLALIGTKHLSPEGLKSAPKIALAAGVVLTLAALALAVFGVSISSLLLLAVAALMGQFGRAWHRLSVRMPNARSWGGISQYFNILVDVAAIACLVLTLSHKPVLMWTLPVFAVALARVAGIKATVTTAPFWNDRALQLALFAGCAVYGKLGEGLAIVGLLACVSLLWDAHARNSTRDAN